MTKQNQLFEAIGSIDNDIAANAIKAAEKSRRKRPLRITAVAAASLAAALALAVGIRNLGGIIGNHIAPADSPVKQGGASYEASGFGESKMSLPNDSADNQSIKHNPDYDGRFYFNVYPNDVVIPESFKPDETESRHCFRDLKMSPFDLFAEFGVQPLMNDNFTDTLDGEPMWTAITAGPEVDVSGSSVEFLYDLYDKNINKRLCFETTYYTCDFGGCYCRFGDECEVIRMNDGNDGFVRHNQAFFAYDGVYYVLTVRGARGDDEENNYIMDVLAELGVL